MAAPRIVILDSDPFSLGALHDPLTDAGYRVFRFRPRDVADAYAVVKRARADLVILDRWLARREDGWALLKRLWADPETTDLPAIVVAGEADALPVGGELLRAMRCRVVRKPLDDRSLGNEIAAALGSQARVDPPHGALRRGMMAGNSPLAADGGEAW